MNTSATPSQEKGAVRVRRKRWVLGVGAVICVLCWVAAALALTFEAEVTHQIVLVTLAAASTEGLIWLGAFVLGMRVFEIRRSLMQRLRAMVGAGRAGA